jgi:hypothetical protein
MDFLSRYLVASAAFAVFFFLVATTLFALTQRQILPVRLGCVGGSFQ